MTEQQNKIRSTTIISEMLKLVDLSRAARLRSTNSNEPASSLDIFILVIPVIENNCYEQLLNSLTSRDLQGGPAKVRPTYIFDGNIWMHK